MSINKKYGEGYFKETLSRAQPQEEKQRVLEIFFELLTTRKRNIRKILDLGCGEGGFLQVCHKKGIECFGVDISSYALKKAKEKAEGQFLRLDLDKSILPYVSDYFDAITVLDLVEHLENPQLVLTEARRVLKKDGVLFLTTLNGGYWLASLFGRFVVNDPTHINLQEGKYWQNEFEKAGFSRVEIKGCLLFGFPPGIRLRWFLRYLKIPVFLKPVFFPILGLTPEFFIFAKK